MQIVAIVLISAIVLAIGLVILYREHESGDHRMVMNLIGLMTAASGLGLLAICAIRGMTNLVHAL